MQLCSSFTNAEQSAEEMVDSRGTKESGASPPNTQSCPGSVLLKVCKQQQCNDIFLCKGLVKKKKKTDRTIKVYMFCVMLWNYIVGQWLRQFDWFLFITPNGYRFIECEYGLHCSTCLSFAVLFKWLKCCILIHTKALMSKGFNRWSLRSGDWSAAYGTKQLHILCQQILVLFSLCFVWLFFLYIIDIDLTIVSVNKEPNVKRDESWAEYISLKLTALVCVCSYWPLDWLQDLHTAIRGVWTVDNRVTRFLRSLTISMYEL